MFRNIDKAIAYIESKRHKNTIESFRRILEELDINTKQKNMIHVAGTNGKGSTVNYLRSILNAHGYHVGTFTSPYMISIMIVFVLMISLLVMKIFLRLLINMKQ